MTFRPFLRRAFLVGGAVLATPFALDGMVLTTTAAVNNVNALKPVDPQRANIRQIRTDHVVSATKLAKLIAVLMVEQTFPVVSGKNLQKLQSMTEATKKTVEEISPELRNLIDQAENAASGHVQKVTDAAFTTAESTVWRLVDAECSFRGLLVSKGSAQRKDLNCQRQLLDVDSELNSVGVSFFKSGSSDRGSDQSVASQGNKLYMFGAATVKPRFIPDFMSSWCTMRVPWTVVLTTAPSSTIRNPSIITDDKLQDPEQLSTIKKSVDSIVTKGMQVYNAMDTQLTPQRRITAVEVRYFDWVPISGETYGIVGSAFDAWRWANGRLRYSRLV